MSSPRPFSLPLGLLLFSLASALAWPADAGTLTGNGTQPGDLTHPLLDPGNCASCHGDFDDVNDIEPWPTWAGSMMANAGRDPIFWAALDVANNDVPGVGEFCLRCHSPTGWLEGRVRGVDDAGCALEGNIDEDNNDFEGLTCHLCHRMMVNDSPPPGQDPVYFENGQFWIDDGDCTSPGSGPCRRGPYDYPGGFQPPHEWAESAYHEASDICGNCHNVTSPVNNLIDETGVDTGIPYPIERTFLEWQQSDYSDSGGTIFATCQNCHMPDSQADPSYACVFPSSPNRTGDMPVHRLVGGNAWVPEVLRGEYPALLRTAEYDATIAGAIAMLESAASVELILPTDADSGHTFQFQVRVTNKSGHKLPTGYAEGRRMWLQVEARDASEVVFWESGAYDVATGVLTEDSQIKVYESQQGIYDAGSTSCEIEDVGGNHLFHFALNDCIAKDNRIPPEGFTGMLDDETRPVAYSYPETSPGSGVLVHWDDTTYEIAIPMGTEGPIDLQARLLFQTMSKDYVEFLRDQAVDNSFPNDCIPRSTGTPDSSRGEILYSLWGSYGRSAPVSMASIAEAVHLDLFADGFESGDTAAWSAVSP